MLYDTLNVLQIQFLLCFLLFFLFSSFAIINLLISIICFKLVILIFCSCFYILIYGIFEWIPDKFCENSLTNHHFCHICSIETIDAIYSHNACLSHQNCSFFREIVSFLMINSKLPQMLSIQRFK